ncbi:acyltransferase 3 [Rhodopirellula maiorica SM1]|uniref:Acyltransferase 3 n=2 Tax=Novipirellula TaxID=2795426 RepID=M5RR72_9BACT|nr:acyltransferase 3 [Rhodopirellula maiorica SM1]
MKKSHGACHSTVESSCGRTSTDRHWWSLRRSISPGRSYVPVIDGLRCIAILFVVVYHLNDYLVAKMGAWERAELRENPLFNFFHVGSCGVPLFFAISGFILSLPFLVHSKQGSAPNLKHYFLRRVTRLEPPYLINLVIIFALLCIVNGQSFAELLPHFGASCLYLHNQIYGQMSQINFVAWSLEIEVQFYLLMPLIAWLFFKRRGRARRSWLWLILIAIVAAKTLYAASAPTRLQLSLPFVLDHFLVGILLADIFVNDWHQNPKRSHGFDALGVVAWTALVCLQFESRTLYLFPLVMLVAYIGAIRGKLIHALLTAGPVPIIGGMCYTIYLFHFYIISFVGRGMLPQIVGFGYTSAILLMIATIVPTVIIVSCILFKLFEQPFMNWRPWSRGIAA